MFRFVALLLVISSCTFGHFTFQNCSADKLLDAIPSPMASEYPWNSFVYKFVGPDAEKVSGHLVFSYPTNACDALTNNVTGRIVFVQDGGCEPEVKSANIQKGGGIALVIYDRVSHLLQQNGRDEENQVNAFALYKGSLTEVEKWDENSLIRALMQLLESESCSVEITPQEYQVGSVSTGWISLSVLIGTFSIINVGLCTYKLVSYFRIQGFNAGLPIIALSIELACNLIRILYCIEPSPLGAGVYPYGFWAFLATGSVSIDLCTTFLIACYWKQALNPRETVLFKKVSLSTMKLVFSFVAGVVIIADYINMFLRALRVEFPVLNIITGIFYVGIAAGFTIYFVIVGVQTILFIREHIDTPTKRTKSNHLVVYVFTNALGQLTFLIGIIYILADSTNIVSPSWGPQLVAFMGLNLMSLSQIIVFRRPRPKNSSPIGEDVN